ncbi:MAG: hypothetical protein AB7G87_12655 [Clostridia bacterium]
MINTYSVFFPSDRDILDVMSCNERKMNMNYLYDLMLSRGILISKADSRQEIIDFASTLNYNYKQFKDISKQVAKVSRNEKISSVAVPCSSSDIDLSKISNDLSAQFGTSPQEKYSTTTQTNIQESVQINIEYEEIDHSKTKLIQKTTKEAVIEIDKTSDGVRIRYTANPKINSRVNALIKILETKLDIPKLKKHEIDFTNISDKSKISEFFESLVTNIEGFKLKDVSSIRLHRPKDDEIQISQDDTDENVSDEIVSDSGGLILKASFVGGGLLTSRECTDFLNVGYYISKIRWVGESLDSSHIRVVMEAELGEPLECNGYKFHIMGQYNPKDEDFDIYTASLRDMDLETKRDVEKKIESSSFRIYDELINTSEDSI